MCSGEKSLTNPLMPLPHPLSCHPLLVSHSPFWALQPSYSYSHVADCKARAEGSTVSTNQVCV